MKHFGYLIVAIKTSLIAYYNSINCKGNFRELYPFIFLTCKVSFVSYNRLCNPRAVLRNSNKAIHSCYLQSEKRITFTKANKHQNFIFQHARICIRDCLLPHNSADIPANRIFVRTFSTQSGYAFSSVHYQFASAFCRFSFRPKIIWQSHNIEYDISFLRAVFSIFYINLEKHLKTVE